jgi:hypothetical protein
MAMVYMQARQDISKPVECSQLEPHLSVVPYKKNRASEQISYLAV